MREPEFRWKKFGSSNSLYKYIKSTHIILISCVDIPNEKRRNFALAIWWIYFEFFSIRLTSPL